MRFIELTLEQPAENLALDEALLEEAESAGQPQETLRLWESPSHVAVVGRSSSVGEEIDLAQCRCAVAFPCCGVAVAGPAY